MFIFVKASCGIVTNNNYHMFIYSQISLIESSSCSCLGHVVNLGNVDVMGHIMKIAAVENVTAIWEYDPTWEDNHVLGGSLDVIVAIHTLTIKVSIILNLWHSHLMHACVDPGIWTTHQIVWKYPDLIWHSRTTQDSSTQQCSLGNRIQDAGPGK